MSANNLPVAGYKLISGVGGNVSPRPASLLGIFVSAASATPTITVYDDAAAGTTTKIVDTFTPVAATWYQLPFGASAGINVVLGGTVSATVAFS